MIKNVENYVCADKLAEVTKVVKLNSLHNNIKTIKTANNGENAIF